MTPEKYQQLCAKIIAANDEIKELKFGCEVTNRIVQNGKWDLSGIIIAVNKYDSESDTYDVYWRETEKMTRGSAIIFDKILGRPITLADVLLAIGQKDGGIMLDGAGEFWKWDSGVKGYDAKWNLRTDNLDDQSDELKSWLHDIICV